MAWLEYLDSVHESDWDVKCMVSMQVTKLNAECVPVCSTGMRSHETLNRHEES